MNVEKEKYLTEIRANTAYPIYRGMIGVITLLGMILAGIQGLSAVIMGFTTMGQTFLGGLAVLLLGLVVAALIFLGAKLFKEAALILVDIGDSITDKNSK